MQLSELGEFGLLAELERRGLARRIENDAAELGDGLDAAPLAERSGCKVVIELDGVPLAPGARLDDLAFGEDYELLAAVEDPDGFAVIGRCEEGAGIELRLHGEPY